MSEKKKTTAPKSAEEKEQKNRIPEHISGAEKLNELIERGKKNGKLTTNEMMDLDGVELDSSTLDRFYDILENLGIALVTEYELPEADEHATEEIDNLKGEIEELKAEDVDPNAMAESFGIDDPVRMYLKEIGKVSLLTQEEELKLAKGMSDGSEAQKMLDAWERLQNPDAYEEEEPEDDLDEEENGDEPDLEAVRNLTPDDIKALKRKVRYGQDCKQRLAEANLRLVVSIAKRYVGRGMLFLDLIQEGNLGLIKAVEKFDYTKGYKFSTYATWWIRQAITRAIADQARTIRIPVHMVETINKVIRVSRQLLQELGHDPSPNEIAAEKNMPVDKVREILKIAQEPVSLETPIGEEEDSHLGDFIPDEGASEPSEAASFTLLKEQLMDVLSTLTPREEKVLKLRFGIEDGRTRTLEEVGKEFNVTRERIRQIEAKALRKLRHPSRSKKLKDFLN